MDKYRKSIMIILLSLAVIGLLLVLPAYACEEEGSPAGAAYSDVDQNHWAYNVISWAVAQKIMGGYPDGTFQPDREITRAEFAKIMVLALGLSPAQPAGPTFLDLPKGYWAYKDVETAKYYLTGFKTTRGDYFKPANAAVREDMAVALVKAMNYGDEAADDSVLGVFADRESISPNLAKYVKIAVKHKMMGGYNVVDSGKIEFRPQSSLTRAEAAALLYNIKKENEEKVTYAYGNTTTSTSATSPAAPPAATPAPGEYPVPNVSGEITGSCITLHWDAIADSRFQGYKVVISRYNPAPHYPDDGYLFYITDRSRTSAVVDNRTAYNGGDFSRYLTPGVKYYFSITALYSDRKVAGNVIVLTMP